MFGVAVLGVAAFEVAVLGLAVVDLLIACLVLFLISVGLVDEVSPVSGCFLGLIVVVPCLVLCWPIRRS